MPCPLQSAHRHLRATACQSAWPTRQRTSLQGLQIRQATGWGPRQMLQLTRPVAWPPVPRVERSSPQVGTVVLLKALLHGQLCIVPAKAVVNRGPPPPLSFSKQMLLDVLNKSCCLLPACMELPL